MAEQAVDLGVLAVDNTKEEINNADIIHSVSLLDGGLYQLGQCQSANMNDTHPEDINICENWVNRFEKQVTVASTIPLQFMPNATPMNKPVPQMIELKVVQNPALAALMNEMTQMRTQLLFNEDSTKLNGFHPEHFRTSIVPWIGKMRMHIALMREMEADPKLTWTPEVDIQPAPVNAGTPR
jgi:hypothetical protein